jgi:hypothetical protein
LGFLVWKQNIWQPCSKVHICIKSQASKAWNEATNWTVIASFSEHERRVFKQFFHRSIKDFVSTLREVLRHVFSGEFSNLDSDTFSNMPLRNRRLWVRIPAWAWVLGTKKRRRSCRDLPRNFHLSFRRQIASNGAFLQPERSWNRVKHRQVGSRPDEQGCQIFPGTTYQKRVKIYVPNDHKMY